MVSETGQTFLYRLPSGETEYRCAPCGVGLEKTGRRGSRDGYCSCHWSNRDQCTHRPDLAAQRAKDAERDAKARSYSPGPGPNELMEPLPKPAKVRARRPSKMKCPFCGLALGLEDGEITKYGLGHKACVDARAAKVST